MNILTKLWRRIIRPLARDYAKRRVTDFVERESPLPPDLLDELIRRRGGSRRGTDEQSETRRF